MVAVIYLAYGREKLTAQSLTHNLPIAGEEFALFVVNKKGIAKAMNYGLVDAYEKGYDSFMFMGNDIKEPANWLKLRLAALTHLKLQGKDPGMISIPFHITYDQYQFIDVIGNVLITKAVVDAVGLFNDDYGDYSPVDCDYNHRTRRAGFVNCYIPNSQAFEIEKSQSEETDRIYGYSKKEAIEKSWSDHVKDVEGYNNGTKSFKRLINPDDWVIG